MSNPDRNKGRAKEFAFIEHLRDRDGVEAQERTKDAMRTLLTSMNLGSTVAESCASQGMSRSTYEKWRKRYPPFKRTADTLVRSHRWSQAEQAKLRQRFKKEDSGLVYDPDREFPEKPPLADFIWTYFGRPSEPHHLVMDGALEDRTNRRVLVFMPTGSGKDTRSGDFVAWLKADSRGTNNVAWFMESQNHSIRRMGRLERYLTDQRMYSVAPAKTPGAQKPERNLIEDFGPFKWQKGMIYVDGTAVDQPKWTQQEMYFVGSDVNEADPDLWATGLNGALYGARIDTAVLSDIFTLENQMSATVRAAQLEWLRSTFESRLDARGRGIVIGTMLPVVNNYEAMMDEWIPEGVAVVYSDQFYTKYANGVAVVRHPAILDEGTEQERSFWPRKFPFKTQIEIPDGAMGEIRSVDADSLSASELMAAIGKGATMVEGLTDMRGEPGTERWRSFQATRQQERVEKSQEVEFPDDILNLCDDYTRTYGVTKPGDIVASQGVDPAKVYFGANLTWVVNRDEGTISVLDYVLMDKLGTSGIRRHLLQEPLMRWRPPWLAFETNRHEGVLDDTAVQTLIRSLGVRVDRIHTNDFNRNISVTSPGALADDMRAHIIRFPAATPADRERTAILKSHFKAWERHSQESGARKTKPGQAGHEPDDLCMAGWVGYPKALEYLQGPTGRLRGKKMPIPRSIQRRFDQMIRRAEGRTEAEPPVSVPELSNMAIERHYADNT